MDSLPPTVTQRSTNAEDVFQNLKARRTALLKALTTDIKTFFHRCDPARANLCLYGHPDGNWEVMPPPEMVPSEFPEPVLGINFARDQMKLDEWVALIADYSDAWLLSVAFYISARYDFHRTERIRLFDMINELPTIYEVILGTTKKEPKESSNSSCPKTMSNAKGKQAEEDVGETQCGGCEEFTLSHFWICCDLCDSWYHGKCVKVTPGMAKYIEQYICPPCNKTKPPSSFYYLLGCTKIEPNV